MSTPRLSSKSFLVVSPVVTPVLCSCFIFLSDVLEHGCAQKLVDAGVSLCSITFRGNRTGEELRGMGFSLPTSERVF